MNGNEHETLAALQQRLAESRAWLVLAILRAAKIDRLIVRLTDLTVWVAERLG